MKWKWRKCEERDSIRQRRERWQCWVKHFIFLSYSLSVSRTAENLSSIDYWDLMFQSSHPSLSLSFPLCFTFPLYPSLHHALPIWLIPNLNVQNRGSKVSQSTFPFCWCCNSSLAGLTKLIAVPSASGRPIWVFQWSMPMFREQGGRWPIYNADIMLLLLCIW